jgi:antitoxin MazE
MRTRVQKWGNSLALRIPQTVAVEAGLTPGSPVELSLVEGRLIVTPAHEVVLEDLLAGVTPDNLHGEVETGGALGGEPW